MSYFDHNDQNGAETRRTAAAWNAARARMLATIEEYDMGAVTLYMPKYEIRARLAEARYLSTTTEI